MFGMQIIQVEPGTVIGSNDDCEDMVVTETSFVCNGRTMWVTPATYEKIKAKAVLATQGTGKEGHGDRGLCIWIKPRRPTR